MADKPQSDLEKALQEQAAYQSRKKGVDLSELQAVKAKSASIQKSSRVGVYVLAALGAAGLVYLMASDPADRVVYLFALTIFGLWAAWRLWQKR